MFKIQTKETTFKTFKLSEVVSFIKKHKNITAKYFYQYKEVNPFDFLKIILKLNGDFKTHLELHKIIFGDKSFKQYNNERL